MCEQCLTNAISFGEVLPGYFLMRARRNGIDWKQGEWGLVEANDPTFTWVSTPTTANCDDVIGPPDDFYEAFDCTPREGYALTMAAIQKGYDPKETSFQNWFFKYLERYLATAEIIDQDDPDQFPDREKTYPTDYSIGKDPLPNEEEMINKYYAKSQL